MDEYLPDYEKMTKQKILSEDMTEKEFGELLEMQAKSYDQRQLIKRINELRPGWVANVRLAELMESYFIHGKVWAVENPTDGDFAKYLADYGLAISTLEIAALIAIGHDYKEKYDQYLKEHEERYRSLGQ